MHDLVLLGGGHAHVEVLRAFALAPQPGLRLTLVGRDIHTPYSGMLPGLVAGHYSFDEAHIDLAPLARAAGARLYHDSAIGLDLARGLVHCAARPPVPFDTLSIDTGATPSFAGVAGAAEHAVPVKPIDRFHARWQELLDWILSERRPVALGVVGAGAGGVELLLAVRHRLYRELRRAGQDPGRVELHLLSAADGVLPQAGRAARAILGRHLRRAGIRLHARFRVVQVAPDGVRAADGRRLALDRVLWVTGAIAPAWPAESGLACTAEGFIRIDERLRSVSHPAVFAAGDVATMDGAPRPKAGVFAVRQGPVLAHNLRAAASGGRLCRHRPQRQHLALISTGPRHAVAVRGPFAVAGRWVWRWKDRIDRRFMRRHAGLPVPSVSGPPDPAPPLPPPAAAPPPGAAAEGELRLGVAGFRPPVDDPWLAGRIAVHHAMAALHAAGARPVAARLFAALPPFRQEAELAQMRAGAEQALQAEGAVLLELQVVTAGAPRLALAVAGRLPAGQAARGPAGLRAGDVLVLAGPLGSAAVLAAAERGQAQGRWWLAALAAMAAPAGPAAEALRPFAPGAMAAVAGPGLAGTLAAMLSASGVAAELRPAAIPLLPGAAACALAGGGERALGRNRAAWPQVAAALQAAGAEPYWHRLLFVPEVAPCLLAGLPPERAEPALQALRAAGCTAAAIGRVLPATDLPPGAIRFA